MSGSTRRDLSAATFQGRPSSYLLPRAPRQLEGMPTEPEVQDLIMASQKTEILKGTLDMLILRSISKDPKHGYGIAQWLEETSRDLLKIEQGSLYPALYRMEERGWIRAKWGITDLGRKAKFYSLTARGREQLEVETQGWERLVEAISLILHPSSI